MDLWHYPALCPIFLAVRSSLSSSTESRESTINCSLGGMGEEHFGKEELKDVRGRLVHRLIL